MLLYKDYTTFTVMGTEVNLITQDTEYGYFTVAEIDNHYHYLGNEQATISTAIFAWQYVKDHLLSDEEFRQVMIDNNIISQGI